MPRFSRVVLASCLVGSALGFEQLAGFKMPSLQGLQKAAQNKAKFGDKKLAIVTGTSSGACRHHRACTASRTAARVRDIYSKKGGLLEFVVQDNQISNQRGELIAEFTRTLVIRHG